MDEAIYGGAAGGGKSDALLMSALQYVDIPGYAALILRRTYSDLSLPSAIMTRSHQWMDRTRAKWTPDNKTWTFPSGATLTFGYLQHQNDMFRYQSAEFQFIGWDELTQFAEYPYRWMFSRRRRLEGSPVPLRTRAASNPGNVGHEWVKSRFIDPETRGERVFLPAKVWDMEGIVDVQEYIKSLEHLDPITRMQYLLGDWTARAGGKTFRREWFPIVDKAAEGPQMRYVRFWDLAATEAAPGIDPDWTAGVLMARDLESGLFYVLDVRRFREGPGETKRMIRSTATQDGIECWVRMEQEPGAAGKIVIDDYHRELAGFNFNGIPSTGSKEVRAGPFASQANAGNVRIVKGPWNEEYLDELEPFPFSSYKDQVDASSGAYNELAKLGMVRKDGQKEPAKGDVHKPEMAGLRAKRW